MLIDNQRTRDGAGFVGGAGVGSGSGARLRLRFAAGVGFLAGALGGLDSPIPQVGGCGRIATPGPMPTGTASGRKSLNSAKRSGASLNSICTWTYTWNLR